MAFATVVIAVALDVATLATLADQTSGAVVVVAASFGTFASLTQLTEATLLVAFTGALALGAFVEEAVLATCTFDVATAASDTFGAWGLADGASFAVTICAAGASFAGAGEAGFVALTVIVGLTTLDTLVHFTDKTNLALDIAAAACDTFVGFADLATSTILVLLAACAAIVWLASVAIGVGGVAVWVARATVRAASVAIGIGGVAVWVRCAAIGGSRATVRAACAALGDAHIIDTEAFGDDIFAVVVCSASAPTDASVADMACGAILVGAALCACGLTGATCGGCFDARLASCTVFVVLAGCTAACVTSTLAVGWFGTLAKGGTRMSGDVATVAASHHGAEQQQRAHGCKDDTSSHDCPHRRKIMKANLPTREQTELL